MSSLTVRASRLSELGLRDEDEAVVLGEILEEQADSAQRRDVHQVRVVDDGREHLAGGVEAPRLLDEALLAAEVGAVGLDLKGLAQDAQGAVVGVQRPVDDRRDECAWGRAGTGRA